MEKLIQVLGRETLDLIIRKKYDGNQIGIGYHADADGVIGAVCIKAAIKKIFEALGFEEQDDLKEANISYIPLQYGMNGTQNIEKLQGKNLIIFIDFCPAINELEMLRDCGTYFIDIYDHHKTQLEKVLMEKESLNESNIRFHFNNDKAGCGIAFEQFINESAYDKNFIENLKFFSDYAEDRDLWKFKLVDSKVINMGINLILEKFGLITNPELFLDFINCSLKNEEIILFNELFQEEELDNPLKIQIKLHELGNSKLFIDNLTINKIFKKGKANKIPKISLFGIELFIFNNSNLISEVGNTLTKLNYPSCQWFVVHEPFKQPEVVLSFRSSDDLPDVSLIAKALGGGGHRNACGATIPLNKLENLLKGII